MVKSQNCDPCAKFNTARISRCVAANHAGAKVSVVSGNARRAGMVRLNSFTFGREAKRDRYLERFECLYHAIKPSLVVRTASVGPTQTGPHVLHSETTKPLRRLVQAVILEVKPLADPERR